MNTFSTILLWATYIVSLYFTIFWGLVFLERHNFFRKEKEQRLKLKKFPLVSVLIPAFNEEKTVIGTIKSVLNLNYPKDKLDVIVINDGSTDRTREIVERFIEQNQLKNVTLISHKNMGKAASLNRALDIAKGEYFACLDADSFVDKDTLKKMLIIFQENGKELAIVTPALKVYKPKNLLQKMQAIEYFIALFIARMMSYLNTIYVAPGPFSLYKREIVKKIGGFDEHNLTEDQEIAYRVQKYQYKIQQCFDGYSYSIAPETLKELYKQRDRWFKGSAINIMKYKKIILNKKYGDFGFIQMLVNIFTFLLGVSAISFFAYYIVRPLIKHLYNLFLLKYDFLTYFRHFFDIDIHLLSFDLPKLFIIYLLLALAILFFVLSYRNANEKIIKDRVWYAIPFFLFYYIIICFFILIVLIELSLGRRQKW